MPSYPRNISLQCFDQLFRACVKLLRIIEEKEIQSPQRLRHRGIVHTTGHNRRESFIQRAACATSFNATSEATESGDSTNAIV